MSAHQLLNQMLPGPDGEDSSIAKWGCFGLLELMGEYQGRDIESLNGKLQS